MRDADEVVLVSQCTLRNIVGRQSSGKRMRLPIFERGFGFDSRVGLKLVIDFYYKKFLITARNMIDWRCFILVITACSPRKHHVNNKGQQALSYNYFIDISIGNNHVSFRLNLFFSILLIVNFTRIEPAKRRSKNDTNVSKIYLRKKSFIIIYFYFQHRRQKLVWMQIQVLQIVISALLAINPVQYRNIFIVFPS